MMDTIENAYVYAYRGCRIRGFKDGGALYMHLGELLRAAVCGSDPARLRRAAMLESSIAAYAVQFGGAYAVRQDRDSCIYIGKEALQRYVRRNDLDPVRPEMLHYAMLIIDSCENAVIPGEPIILERTAFYPLQDDGHIGSGDQAAANGDFEFGTGTYSENEHGHDCDLCDLAMMVLAVGAGMFAVGFLAGSLVRRRRRR